MSASPSSPQTEREQIVLRIQKWGLAGLMAALLESGAAFGVLAAQSMYVAQPILENWISRRSLHQWAQLLEDPQQSAQLAQALRDRRA